MAERMYLWDGQTTPLTVANGRQGEGWIMRVLQAGGTVTLTRPGRQPWRQRVWPQKYVKWPEPSRSGQGGK